MPMTQEHRDALARGRAESRAIRAYLDAVAARKSGRAVTRETLEKRIVGLQEAIDEEENPLKRVDLIQRRMEAEQRLEAMGDGPDVESLQAGFVEYAKSYSERKGISYTAWREGGVPAAVLREAGIKRG